MIYCLLQCSLHTYGYFGTKDKLMDVAMTLGMPLP